MTAKLRSLAAVLAVVTLMLQPAAVLATSYSGWQWKGTHWVDDHGWTSQCMNTGIVDIAKNETNVHTYVAPNSSSTNCSGSVRVLPAGWIRLLVGGYRDGAWCGSTGFYYTSSPTWGFGIQWQACSNPAGSQSFFSYGYSGTWNVNNFNSSGYQQSPGQNY